MTLDDPLIEAIADAVASRLQIAPLLPGWPEGRGTLNESEAAAYLGIGVEFLRQLRHERRISHRKIGRRIVYATADIAAFLEACRQQSMSPDDLRRSSQSRSIAS